MTAGKVLGTNVWDGLKNHHQEYQQKPDLIFSDSMTEFIGKIDSTAYRTIIKADQGNKATIKIGNQNPAIKTEMNWELSMGFVCVCKGVCSKRIVKDKKEHSLKT